MRSDKLTALRAGDMDKIGDLGVEIAKCVRDYYRTHRGDRHNVHAVLNALAMVAGAAIAGADRGGMQLRAWFDLAVDANISDSQQLTEGKEHGTTSTDKHH